jgi:hypothetical protein
MNAFQMGQVLGAIQYKDWTLHIGEDKGRAYLQWQFNSTCAKTGAQELQHCRKWQLSPFMTESELVQTAFAAALSAEEHECREFFTYAGKRPFQPHISVQALMEVCDREDVRQPIGVAA